MSGFQVVVLIWLALLTLWYLGLRYANVRLTRLLVAAKVLVDLDAKPPELDYDDPKNNPFLKAGLDAIKRKEGSQDE